MVFVAILLLLALLILYIRKTNQLSQKIFKIESELRGLRNAVHSSQSTPTPAAEPAVERAIPPAPAVLREPSPVVPRPVTPLSPIPPSRTREEWESLIGGKLLNRIGAFALILGVGFFLKYAFDNNWISETVRVLIGFVAGALLLFGGARWHKKGLAIFAQGLIGAGIAIFYLCVYASFNFYHLVSQPVAFVWMSAVTALTFFHGWKYDSLAVAVLGWAGGFLTPFLLSTGQANEVGLFTYIMLLDIGLLAILLKKARWVILEPLTLAATYLIYFTWQDKFYVEEKLFVTVFFLTIFWGLFYALDVYRTLEAAKTFENIRQAVAGANGFLYFVALYDIVDAQHQNWTSAVTLLLGVVYFLTFLYFKRQQPEAIVAARRHTLTAIVLLVIATEIQFGDFQTVIFWSLEALALVWCGMNWKMRDVWQAALTLSGLAVLRLLFSEGALSYSPIASFPLLLNQRALTFAVLGASLATGAVLFKRIEDKNSALIQALLHGAWIFLLFVLCTVETNDFFRRRLFEASGDAADSLAFNRLQNLQQLTLSGIWLFYSVVLMVTGLWRRWQGLRIISMALFGITILKIFIYDLSFLERLYRIFSFIGLGVILLAVSYLYQRYKAVIFENK
ncbi:MAG: DUF2339 domain-containing protein [candidate division KSB1 bacterium]|nr:DUF2339 domain-containing protein [candidate division KSB1 bacterium]MDZ7366041.1 DUF2339 domain-containing protein [candidate division KSB1 bacterium]MDZ7404158.1 DUF2339 domain-containing protein [candidate division KSB1 bacterium]